ncbi:MULTISPECIES: ABC transporter ATP-binding protein [Clostridium]|uniref:ATP-binding cassette domain-containing protein n=1 Tax=Clostridium tetanomorphum TaxID=1553 RepID=A0A923EBP2_CLOTT|nr:MULTISPECIES: ATP-binding cassette domain-containing protein [Clostridium]MBC2398809.1 ATP-binding cassette domain-containing protein [Clostridium tetanomorphum]MBC2425617.1 ATP-binding cassette domain-containing protein [Clostridium beijerinckii]NRZ96825.1 ABC-2 type transport system ATP-binding protein [Clostridium tetanomorphum]
MNNSIVVKTENLTKTFYSKEVVKNFNMTVYEGSIYGFLGANGAGKTTIFKLVTDLLKPTMGKIEILGMDMAVSKNDILRNIGCIIETPVFYEHLSAAENLKIHLGYMHREENNIEQTLECVGLVGVGKQSVSTFSIGMRQRLAIARAIIHKPKLLILDEPISGLDPMGIRDMRELFLKLAKTHNMTILISSHILSEIEHIADTIGVINNGKIVKEAALSSLKTQFTHGLENYFLDVMNGGK